MAIENGTFCLYNKRPTVVIEGTLCVYTTDICHSHVAQVVVSTCEGFDHPIDPVKRMHLQFRLLSIPTNGPQLFSLRLWYVQKIPCCLSEKVAYVPTAGFPKEICQND